MAIKRDQVVAAIHAGIRSASDTYWKWSLDWTLAQSGVEALMVVEICRKLVRRLAAPRDARNVDVNAGPRASEWNGASKYSGALSGGQHSEDAEGTKPRWASIGPRR